MRTLFFFIITTFCFFACRNPKEMKDRDVLVQLNDKVLTRPEVDAIIPKGSSAADSTLFAESFIKKWIKDELVYEVAQRNLNEEQPEIDKLVEAYRNSLVRYRYQEKLLRERLATTITDADKRKYYEDYEKTFVLDKNLIKGLFLKIPVDAPNLEGVKGWYKSDSETSIEKIEKYSVQNAVIYEYFYDKWVDFDEVMDNIPKHISDPASFLKSNKSLEAKDSLYVYLLNIKEYLPVGSIAPYDFAEPEIQNILLNQRKLNFIKEFENELYNDALKKGKVTYSFEQ